MGATKSSDGPRPPALALRLASKDSHDGHNAGTACKAARSTLRMFRADRRLPRRTQPQTQGAHNHPGRPKTPGVSQRRRRECAKILHGAWAPFSSHFTYVQDVTSRADPGAGPAGGTVLHGAGVSTTVSCQYTSASAGGAEAGAGGRRTVTWVLGAAPVHFQNGDKVVRLLSRLQQPPVAAKAIEQLF